MRLVIDPLELSADRRCSQFRGSGPLEHYAAAFALSGCADWILEVSGPDLPLADGSSLAMMSPLERALPWLQVPSGFEFEASNERGGWLRVRAAAEFAMVSCWALPSGEIQTWTAKGEGLRSCAQARTFIEIDDLAKARAAGLLQGCALGQGLVLGPAQSQEGASLAWRLGLEASAGVLSGLPLRMPCEVAAHKVLDLVGDLALWTGGIPVLEIQMQAVGHREFHALGRALNERMSCGSA
jgi:UDP-3-O-acyl-N-acetylglucosamine deacetylase